MNLIEIIDAVPKIIQYFISGYIFMSIFMFITSIKINISIKMIFSCIISFILIALMNIIFINMDIWLRVLISCGVSIIISITLGLLYMGKLFDNILVKIFSYSPRYTVWDDVIDLSTGSNLKIYLNNEPYYIIGHFRSRDNKDGDFYVSLSA